MEKTHISYSQLADFLACNFKHHLGYGKKLKTYDPDNIHLVFGIHMHSTIELYLKKQLTKVEAYKYFSDCMLSADNLAKYNASELVKFRNQGNKILIELFNRFSWDGIVIIDNELDLEEPIFDNFVFKAKIDFIYKYKNFIYIADWKTSTDEWNDYKLNDKYFGLQLKLYKYFYAQKFKIPMDSIRLVYFVLNRNDSNQPVKNLVSMFEVDARYGEIKKSYDTLVDALKVMYYPDRIGEYLQHTIGWNCNVCEFNGTEHCKGNVDTKFYRNIKEIAKTKKETRERIEKEVEKALQTVLNKMA